LVFWSAMGLVPALAILSDSETAQALVTASERVLVIRSGSVSATDWDSELEIP